MKLYCHSAVKRCMSNRWFQISYIVLYRERYEMITCKLILRYSASVLSSYFNVLNSLCDFQLFLQAESDILWNSIHISIIFHAASHQAQFLEYRISCITRTLVLDFSRADAADLASKGNQKALELELRGNCFFGDEPWLFETYMQM